MKLKIRSRKILVGSDFPSTLLSCILIFTVRACVSSVFCKPAAISQQLLELS